MKHITKSNKKYLQFYKNQQTYGNAYICEITYWLIYYAPPAQVSIKLI